MHVVVCARGASSDCGGLVVKAREHLSPRLPVLCHIIQLAAIWWIPFRRGGVGPQKGWEFVFTAEGGRGWYLPLHTYTHSHKHTHTYTTTPIRAMIVIHPSPPPHSFAFIRVPQSFITLWPLLVRVCVSMCVRKYWVDKKECSALFLLTVHVVITVWA